MAASTDAAAELSAAIVGYLRSGSASWPGADDEAAAAQARTTDPAALVAEVRSIVAESLGVPVDWSSTSLGDAGQVAAAEMGARHPGLSTEALDALAWNFSFQWR